MLPDTTGKKVVMDAMAKDVIHISDKEAASGCASLLGRVREGAEACRGVSGPAAFEVG
jgi:hypothetical protein